MYLKPGHRDDLLELADTLGDVSWQLELLAGRIGTPELISIANLIEAAGNALALLAREPRPGAWGPKPTAKAVGVYAPMGDPALRNMVLLPTAETLAYHALLDEYEYACDHRP